MQCNELPWLELSLVQLTTHSPLLLQPVSSMLLFFYPLSSLVICGCTCKNVWEAQNSDVLQAAHLGLLFTAGSTDLSLLHSVQTHCPVYAATSPAVAVIIFNFCENAVSLFTQLLGYCLCIGQSYHYHVTKEPDIQEV